MSPDYYLNIDNIKIKTNDIPIANEILFKDIYYEFNNIYSEDYDKLLLNILNKQFNGKKLNYGNDIYENIIKVIDKEVNDKNNLNNLIKNFDMKKIYDYLLKLEENIPMNISYKLADNIIKFENIETNPSLFRKNRFGVYFNFLDESLLYEINFLNDKINSLHNEITIFKNMIKGELNYNYDYYQSINILNEGKIPPILNIYNNIDYLNINQNINIYIKIIENRISYYKKWIKDGQLQFYHLPIFTNIQLFIYCLKMNFSRKYYGENNYSKITPDMILLTFIPTKYNSFNELYSQENEIQYYQNLYKNEIIWVDGLILNNAYLSKNNKNIFFKNLEKIKTKMNIVGITYTIKKFDNINSESESNSEENEESESRASKTENNDNLKDKKEDISEDNEGNYKNININEEKKLRVFINENRDPCIFNKYYISKSIGYIDFGFEGNFGQNYIYENDIKITIEDLNDF